MVLKKGFSFIIILVLLAFVGQASAGSNANATVSLDLIAGGVVNKIVSGEFADMQLHLDTQIETPAGQSNRLTISEKKAGDTIQLQLFVPMAAGKQTYGYEIELDLPGKTFSNYIGSISGKDFTGASLFSTSDRPILSALLISTPVVPANGYLGQIDLQVINTLEAETTLIVKAASMAGLNRQQDPLDVSNAVITITVISHPGDFDGDLDVDFADFLAFVGVFGLSSSDANYDTRMDMNSDGAVNFADFLAFVGVFGRSFGKEEIEHFEPEGLVLIDSGNRFFRYFQGETDASGGRVGHLRVPNGGLTPKWSIHFLDEDGDEIDPPDEPGFKFTATIADPTVVEVHQEPADVGKFEFQLRGLKAGETTIVLEVTHDDHIDFRTIPIPVRVVNQ